MSLERNRRIHCGRCGAALAPTNIVGCPCRANTVRSLETTDRALRLAVHEVRRVALDEQDHEYRLAQLRLQLERLHAELKDLREAAGA